MNNCASYLYLIFEFEFPKLNGARLNLPPSPMLATALKQDIIINLL